MSSPEPQPPGPRHPGAEDGASLIAGGEPPGCDPWSDLGHWFEPRWLSKVVRSDTLPFYLVSYSPSFYRPCGIIVVEWPEAAEVCLVKFVGELTARGREPAPEGGMASAGPSPV